MAKRRKRRRPNAGPPPVKNARREDKLAAGEDARPTVKGVRAPRLVSLRGIAIRAMIVAGLFYPYLVYIAGEPPATAALLMVVAFAIMLPLGFAIDKVRYRLQMRNYEKRISAE